MNSKRVLLTVAKVKLVVKLVAKSLRETSSKLRLNNEFIIKTRMRTSRSSSKHARHSSVVMSQLTRDFLHQQKAQAHRLEMPPAARRQLCRREWLPPYAHGDNFVLLRPLPLFGT